MITFSGCSVACRPDATEALFDSAENAAISQSKLQALVQISLSVRAQLHLHALGLSWVLLRVQLHLPVLDLAWALLRVQLHLPALDLAWTRK